MLDARIFDDMADQLSKILPAGASELKADFEKNSKAVVQSALAKMDLVTREDFDVQVALLQKTTLRLKALEERIAALELLSQEQ
jgi:BMFP domain-containing protein YqiC